jgi:hypothetical protein
MPVVFLDTDTYAFTNDEIAVVRSVLDEAETEVRTLLPSLPAKLSLLVYPTEFVIPELGSMGMALSPDVIQLSVDPEHAGGVAEVADATFRFTLFHECHHATREKALGRQGSQLVPSAIHEGLATAFERDFAGHEPLWGYDKAVIDSWTEEFLALGAEDYRDWFFNHPDGRRWIGYKVGTYLVDRAIANGDTSAVKLLPVEWRDVLTMAGYSPT